MTADPAVQFWLRWAQSEGALYESAGDVALAVLPGGVRDSLGLPEEVALTADPEVAREDGALLLASGHPLLDHATEAVLRRGDADSRVLAVPAAPMPDERSLLVRAREAFPVDHGRIDLAGPAVPCRLPVLRLGALITYAVALDERFQEQAEVWVDVEAAAAVPDRIAERLSRAAEEPAGDVPEPMDVQPVDVQPVDVQPVDVQPVDVQPVDVRPADLEAAAASGHRLLEGTALARRHDLSGQLARVRTDELDRTRTYYQAMLAGLGRRRIAATPERRGALDAKAEATRAERDRRLAEVEEKFRPHHDIRPFRLHLLWVPALRVAVHVRRGPRVYPVSLHWLRPAAAFTPLHCRDCGAPEPWVAGKARLGCRSCLPGAAVIPARGTARRVPADTGNHPHRCPAETPPPAKDEVEPTERVAPKPSASPAGRPRTATSAGPLTHTRPGDRPGQLLSPAGRRRLGSAGDKLGIGVWQATLEGNRRLRRLIAPDSPAAAVHRLYGAGGLTLVLGMRPGEDPTAVNASTLVSEACSGVTSGVVHTSSESQPYSLRWELVAGRPAMTELLPVPCVFDLRLPWLGDARFMPASLRRPPVSQLALDPVAQALWTVLVPRAGLLVVARCLAAYWRLDGEAAVLHPAPVLAAALAHQVGRRAGLAITYAEAATEFGVEEDRLRSAATRLTRQLGLSATRVW